MQKSVEVKLVPELDLPEDDEQEEKEFVGRHDGEEEFSFMSSFGALSLVSADEAFINGEIKPVFPLFNQELLFDQTSRDFDEENLPKKPTVKKIFVQTEEEQGESSSSGGDVISGPYCDLSSRRVVEVTSPSDSCKKSNSTGFSKIWRFKDLVSRTNSDGRDAFVFLNEPGKKPERTVVRSTDKVKVNANGRGKRTTPYSAHEVYLRRKGKEDKRRPPSYLPYRPELMGFFTSVNGGFSKNVHPY